MVQSSEKDSASRVDRSTTVAVSAMELDPYTFENRQKLILDRRVDWYLCSRPDAVRLHSQKLPRFPNNNPAKRKLRKPIPIKISDALTIELVGVLGAGSFAYVFSAKIIDQDRNSTEYKAVKLGIAFPEVLAVYYGIKMLRCIELLHRAQVLHGDIKPDNWLMTPGNPTLELSINQGPSYAEDFQGGDLILTDYGRSIDLSVYPDGTTFKGNCHAKGFQSVEMLTHRPWTHQIDTFAFCGTMHCMLFGKYMEVKLRRNPNGVPHWGIVGQFKRYWQVDMWKDLFDALLNVKSCSEQPSLPDLRRRLENYLLSDQGRQKVRSPLVNVASLLLTYGLLG
ncbi:unnamed protein product [Phytophthora lilii]|uniref:Unnamed protein product n=1 Tax=Phytophthora lilii TaxID=2077276 RepID=A0A9W6TFZ6_9STRA|nr:unnamed protein product [Phytophthora lilii]